MQVVKRSSLLEKHMCIKVVVLALDSTKIRDHKDLSKSKSSTFICDMIHILVALLIF